jgi:hypothetical protein
MIGLREDRGGIYKLKEGDDPADRQTTYTRKRRSKLR